MDHVRISNECLDLAIEFGRAAKPSARGREWQDFDSGRFRRRAESPAGKRCDAARVAGSREFAREAGQDSGDSAPCGIERLDDVEDFHGDKSGASSTQS